MHRKALWKLEPHTKAKHDIFQRYLEAWYPILSSWGGRVVILDGFAGPGIYEGGEPGSPMIALRSLLEHRAFATFRCEFIFVFLEPQEERFESLQAQLETYRKEVGGWPSNVKVLSEQTQFEKGAREILDSLGDKSLAPTFAFIDPFGFSGIPLQLICELVSFDRCELFITFMFDSINRFLTEEKVSKHIEAVFGTKDYIKASDLSGEARKRFLHDLYKAQLLEQCGFKYVQSFEMVNEQSHTVYFLFYATRHPIGLSRMKDAMWKADPGQGSSFQDRFAGQQILLSGENTDFEPLKEAVYEEFRGREVTVQDVEAFVIESTPYREAHVRKHVLIPLDDEGKLEVHNQKRRHSYKNAKIRFRSPGK